MLLGLKDSDFIAVVALMHSPRAAMAEELSVMQTRLDDARDSVGGHMDHPHDVVEDTGESSMELLAENSDDDISYDCSSMYLRQHPRTTTTMTTTRATKAAATTPSILGSYQQQRAAPVEVEVMSSKKTTENPATVMAAITRLC
jgi:hypothetical protein